MGTASKREVQVVKRQQPTGLLVRVSGVIDEHFRKEDLALQHPVVVFDMAGVTAMTSFGIREWMRGLALVDADYYCYIRCPPLLVSQFNLVQKLRGRGDVVSLYAPYLCPSCDHSFNRYIDLRREYDELSQVEPPTLPCPQCGAAAEFDDLPDLYFRQVLSTPRPQPPLAANAIIDSPVLDREETSEHRGFSIRKEVEDAVTAFWLSGHVDKSAYFRHLSHGLQGHVLCIAADVDSATRESLIGLLENLAVPNVKSYLARIPPPVAQSLLGLGAELRGSNVSVLSVRIPFSCRSCGFGLSLDLDRTQLLAVGTAPGGLQICPQCTAPLHSAIDPAEIHSYASLPMVRSPEAVAAYLMTHPEAGLLTEIDGTGESSAERIFGKYQLVKRLGRGGMGELFLARLAGPGDFEKMVVVKRVRRDRVSSPEAMQEIVREARIAARLTHRNIVQIFDCGKSGEEYFIAMEYVRGIDLASALAFSSRIHLKWSIPLCCRIATDLCSALQAAHTYTDGDGKRLPIIHRDVSPENVLLGEDGTVKLTDFGIAMAADVPSKTEPGVFKGKTRYAAPERIRGMSRELDPRIDIYGAGVILFECLTGARYELLIDSKRITQVPTASARALRGEVSPELDAAIASAVAIEPERRFANAGDFRAALDAALRQGERFSSEDMALWVRNLMSLRAEAERLSPTIGEGEQPTVREGPSIGGSGEAGGGLDDGA